jgi:hypothetical protein
MSWGGDSHWGQGIRGLPCLFSVDRIVGSSVSRNVAVVQIELKIGFIERTGVHHIVVWCIYQVAGNRIAIVRLAGQPTGPETKRFLQYRQPAK